MGESRDIKINVINIDSPWTKEEMNERRKFYARSGIVVFKNK